ncbi:unnamed protein product [Cuscuta campestris]|uniref:Uncharacterized protein n=1 Tax=Cuscuta campestris TaxID=132261 RepID=A0A484NAV0_9ASTE|nr:unnamed protein product [Cuscuta campestris]VFQ99705.1 unnamed protein product [Cuscuta campestris]
MVIVLHCKYLLQVHKTNQVSTKKGNQRILCHSSHSTQTNKVRPENPTHSIVSINTTPVHNTTHPSPKFLQYTGLLIISIILY